MQKASGIVAAAFGIR